MTEIEKAFLDLVKAGLWKSDVWLSDYGQVDFERIYQLASEQSVVGLIAAGLERVIDKRTPQELSLIFAGEVLQLEQRNQAMNEFIAKMIQFLRRSMYILCL